MNDANLLRSRVARINADYQHCADSGEVKAQQIVGQDAEPMSDQEREAAAFRAGNAMQAWYARYQETGDRDCLDVAYRHMQQLVALRWGGQR